MQNVVASRPRPALVGPIHLQVEHVHRRRRSAAGDGRRPPNRQRSRLRREQPQQLPAPTRSGAGGGAIETGSRPCCPPAMAESSRQRSRLPTMTRCRAPGGSSANKHRAEYRSSGEMPPACLDQDVCQSVLSRAEFLAWVSGRGWLTNAGLGEITLPWIDRSSVVNTNRLRWPHRGLRGVPR